MSRNKTEGQFTTVAEWFDAVNGTKKVRTLNLGPNESPNRRTRNDNKMMWRALREHRYKMGFSEGELP